LEVTPKSHFEPPALWRQPQNRKIGLPATWKFPIFAFWASRRVEVTSKWAFELPAVLREIGGGESYSLAAGFMQQDVLRWCAV